MSKIFIPTRGAEDWQRLLGDPEKHWRDGYSAKSTALSWEKAKGLPRQIAGLFETHTELLLAIPEHKVPMPGRGRGSQCDVFALVRCTDGLIAISVEAKVNEPFGSTIGDWLSKGGQGRADRLDGICRLLEVGTPPAHLRYQLFHRTAAALIEAQRFAAPHAAMVVQSFSPEHRWHEDFAEFCDFLLLPGERDKLHSRILGNGLTLSLAWASAPSS